MRSYFAIILVANLKHIIKSYKYILLDQKNTQYFWYMIIINPHEATVISVPWGLFSWFHLKIWKLEGCMWKYRWQNSNTLEKEINIFLSTSRLLCLFLYKIFINPHEATDSSVSSGACFHDYILKSGNEKVVCKNMGCKAQTH